MSREEELILLQEFIEQNGIKTLPPCQGNQEIITSAWGKPRGRKGRKKK